MTQIFIGVDPGASGAIAGVDADGAFLFAKVMPVYVEGKSTAVDAVAVRRILDAWAITATAVERVSAMPGQGVSSMFNFGKSYGTVLGVIGAMGYSRRDVAPQSWKKHFNLLGTEKDASRGLAIKMFPGASLGRKKDHGMADALLIARWLRDTVVAGI